MPFDIRLERRGFGFVPATPADEEELSAIPIGAHVKARITRSKSRPMLRLYWAVVEEVGDAVGMGKVELSQALLCATRRIDAFHVKTSAKGKTETFFVPQHISKMDGVELRDFVTAAFAILFEFYAAPESRDQVFKIAERKAQTTFAQAMRDLGSKEAE